MLPHTLNRDMHGGCGLALRARRAAQALCRCGRPPAAAHLACVCRVVSDQGGRHQGVAFRDQGPQLLQAGSDDGHELVCLAGLVGVQLRGLAGKQDGCECASDGPKCWAGQRVQGPAAGRPERPAMCGWPSQLARRSQCCSGLVGGRPCACHGRARTTGAARLDSRHAFSASPRQEAASKSEHCRQYCTWGWVGMAGVIGPAWQAGAVEGAARKPARAQWWPRCLPSPGQLHGAAVSPWRPCSHDRFGMPSEGGGGRGAGAGAGRGRERGGSE